jgi:hypothetical protein
MASVRAAEAAGHKTTADKSQHPINIAVEAARVARGCFVQAREDLVERKMQQIGPKAGPEFISKDEPNKLFPPLDTEDLGHCWHAARRAGWTKDAILQAIDKANEAYLAFHEVDAVISGLRGGAPIAEQYQEAKRDMMQVISALYNLHQECDLHSKTATKAAVRISVEG